VTVPHVLVDQANVDGKAAEELMRPPARLARNPRQEGR